MKIESLIVLEYASNRCYVHVEIAQKVKSNELNINIEKGTYGEDIQIGDENQRHNRRIIGVYDSTNIEHLKRMVYHATEAIRSHGSAFDD